MRDSLRALLTGIIDYAGLFQPARLPLAEALRNYVAYRKSAEQWLLGKFICPAGQLSELATLLNGAAPLSILGRGGNDGASFFANLKEDVALSETFCRQSRQARVEGFEVRLPADIVSAPSATQVDLVRQASGIIRAMAPSAFIAFEAGFPGAWRTSLHTLAAGMQQLNEPQSCLGLKLRCGGLDAATFPSIEQVAFVLHTCREKAIPLKFTAGLHHPFRHVDRVLGIPVHGFLNVFTAGVFAQAEEAQRCDILADGDPAHFQFDDGELRWRELRATVEEIELARRRFVVSLGSCSFTEPLDDLRKLGWL